MGPKAHLNQQIDKSIAKNEKKQKQTNNALHQKRKRFEILSQGETNRASKRYRKEPENVENYLEMFIENPGLQHLAENIFLNLNYKDLKSCHLINRGSKVFFDNSRFWIKKFVQKGLSKQNEINWINAIQITKHTNYQRHVLLYLKKVLSKKKIVDFPCFIDKHSLRQVRINGNKSKSMISRNNDDYNSCWIQICWNPLDQGYLHNFLRLAVGRDHLKVTKALIPLIDNPNAPDPLFSQYDTEEHEWRTTTFHLASEKNNLEIMKFLVPFADNLNVTNLQISITSARIYGHHNVVKYLESFMNSQ